MSDDPNRDSNDPMVPEYWSLGEDLQDRIRSAGYDHGSVDGIAVDLHDLLQSADSIRELLASDLPLNEQVAKLRFELGHIRWHCDSGLAYLEAAESKIGAS